MALSAFEDRTQPPAPDDLRAVLGVAAACWTALVADVREAAGPIDETWSFGGPKYGWSMRLVQGKRVLVYLTPQAGQLLVGAVLGEKAIAAAEASGLTSRRTLDIVRAAPKYAEGRGVRIPVVTDDDLVVARELVRIKLGR
jgi:hypothetical protein